MVASTKYLGELLYGFAESQTEMNLSIKESQRSVAEVQRKLEEESVKRDKALDKIKDTIDQSHKEVEEIRAASSTAANEAMAAKQKVQELDDSLRAINHTVMDILTVTESHDEDIKATRNKVAPRDTTPRGH